MRLRLRIGDASPLDRLRRLLDTELPSGEVDILPARRRCARRRCVRDAAKL